jgi:ribosomal protein S8
MKQNETIMLEKKDLEKIRERLPNTGYVEAINKVLEDMGQKKYSSSNIRLTLNGHRRNDQIVLAAIKVAEETQRELQKIKEMSDKN